MARTAYLLLLFTALFWGGNAVAGKLAVGHISPGALTTARWVLAILILLAIGHRQLVRDWPAVRRHWPLMAALGACGFAAFNITLYTALLYTTAINAAILQAGMPLLVFAANFALFALRVSPLQIIGFSLTVVGIALTAGRGDLWRVLALDLNRGDAIMLLAVVLYGGYTVALRFKPQVHWLSLMIVMATAALVTSLPWLAYEARSGALFLPDTQGWLVAVYAGLFPSILAQVFYIRGNEIIGANRASLFINLVPIFGAGLSVLVLGEALRPWHAIALALVLGGIWIAERGGRRIAAAPGR